MDGGEDLDGGWDLGAGWEGIEHDEEEEGVLNVGEEGVEAVLRDRQALRFQGIVELLDAERGAGISQQVALQPAQGDGIGYGVALDHITENGDIDVALKERAAVAGLEVLSLREAAFGQVAAEGVFEDGSAGFGKGVPIGFRKEVLVQFFQKDCLDFSFHKRLS